MTRSSSSFGAGAPLPARARNPTRRGLRRRRGKALGLSYALLSVAAVAQQNPHRREPAAAPESAQAPGAGATERTPVSPLSAHVAAETSLYTDSNGVTVVTPAVEATLGSAAREWQASGHYLTDIVSAASVDIVSTASPRWTEIRHEAGLGAKYQVRDAGVEGHLSASSEPDYLSLGGGALLLFELADKTVNPVFAYSFTHDTAGRTGTPFSVFSHELSRHAATVGLELILDRRTSLFLQSDAFLELGDQSKPYRFLPLFAPEVAPTIQPGASLATVNQRRLPGRITERVPGRRLRLSLSGRVARRYRHSTLILFQRLYADDWGLWAATEDLRFVHDLGRRWALWSALRSHLQSGAFFWKRAYSATFSDAVSTVPTYRSGDRELGPLLSATLGAGARLGLGAEPRPFSTDLTLQAEGTATRFQDALFLDGRLAGLVMLGLEMEF